MQAGLACAVSDRDTLTKKRNRLKRFWKVRVPTGKRCMMNAEISSALLGDIEIIFRILLMPLSKFGFLFRISMKFGIAFI